MSGKSFSGWDLGYAWDCVDGGALFGRGCFPFVSLLMMTDDFCFYDPNWFPSFLLFLEKRLLCTRLLLLLFIIL